MNNPYPAYILTGYSLGSPSRLSDWPFRVYEKAINHFLSISVIPCFIVDKFTAYTRFYKHILPIHQNFYTDCDYVIYENNYTYNKGKNIIQGFFLKQTKLAGMGYSLIIQYQNHV